MRRLHTGFRARSSVCHLLNEKKNKKNNAENVIVEAGNEQENHDKYGNNFYNIVYISNDHLGVQKKKHL